MTTTTNDQHAVFARLDGSRYVRVTGWTNWASAIDTWTRLDDVRQAARRRKDGVTNVDYLAVRSQDDPQWNTHPFDPAALVATFGPGSVDDRAVLRRIGERLGLVGKEGGWIYRRDEVGRRPITQGWGSFRSRWAAKGLIVQRVDPDRTPGSRIRWFENAYHVVGAGR